jgi:hypothetical protein
VGRRLENHVEKRVRRVKDPRKEEKGKRRR